MTGHEVIKLIQEIGAEKEVMQPYCGDDYEYYTTNSVTGKSVAMYEEEDEDQDVIIIDFK